MIVIKWKFLTGTVTKGARRPLPGMLGAKSLEQTFFEESPCRFWSEVWSAPVKKLGEFGVSGWGQVGVSLRSNNLVSLRRSTPKRQCRVASRSDSLVSGAWFRRGVSEMHSGEAVHSRSFVAYETRERVKGSLITLIFSIKRDKQLSGLCRAEKCICHCKYRATVRFSLLLL